MSSVMAKVGLCAQALDAQGGAGQGGKSPSAERVSLSSIHVS